MIDGAQKRLICSILQIDDNRVDGHQGEILGEGSQREVLSCEIM